MIIDEDKAMQALNGLLNPFITQNGAQPLDPAGPQSPDVTPEIPTQEPPADEPEPAAEPAPTEPSHPDSKIYDILGDNIVADNVYNTVDIAKSVAATPLKIGNDVLNAGIDAVNAGLRFFDDEDDGPALQIPNNRLPEFLDPQTAAGKFAQTAASWYLGGKIIDTAVAARAIASSVTMPGRIEQVRSVGNAIQELGRVITGPRPYTGQGAVAEYAKEAVKDFILNSPQDDTLATYLKETGMVDHPFFDLMAIEDDDDYLIRRMKHSLEGGVIGVTLDAAFEAGRAGMKLLKKLAGTDGTAEAAEAIQGEFAQLLEQGRHSEYVNRIGQRIRTQLQDLGRTDEEITSTLHFLESYAANAKAPGQTIADYLEELPIVFRRAETAEDFKKFRRTRAHGFFDAETKFEKILNIDDHFSQLKDDPIEIVLNINNPDNVEAPTIMHELGHFFLWDFARRAGQPHASRELRQHAHDVFEFIGVKPTDEKFTGDACEKFAHNFEQWLEEGKAPTPFLEEAFNNFREWVKNLKRDMDIVGEVTPPEREKIYARFFTTPDMDDELKNLYAKGYYIREKAEDIVDDMLRQSDTRETFFREAVGDTEVPTGRTPRTGAINFDYVDTPDIVKIVGRRLEEAVAERLPKHIKEPMTWDKIARKSVDLHADLMADDDAMAEKLKVYFNDTRTAPAAAAVSNTIMTDAFQKLTELLSLATDAEARGAFQEAASYRQKALRPAIQFENVYLINTPQVVTAARIEQVQQMPKGITQQEAEAIHQVTAGLVQMVQNGEDITPVMKRLTMMKGDLIKTGRYLSRLNEPWTRKTAGITNTVYTNSLLSNPATWLVSAVGNAAVTLMSPFEYMVGGYVRKGLARGADALGLGAKWLDDQGDDSIRKGTRLFLGIKLAWKDALDAARAAWKNENTVWATKHNVSMVEYGPERWIQSGTFGLDPQSTIGWTVDAIGQIIELPSRILMATDDFFKVLNGRAMLFANLWDEALSKGLTKADDIIRYVRDNFDSRVIRETQDGNLVREVLKDPQARDYAMKQTFSNDGGVLVKAISEMKQKYPLLHPLIPFVRTPARIMDWTIQRTPLGLLYKSQREAVMQGGAEASKVLGQWAVGSALIGSAVMLAQEGRITGGGPRNPQARKAMQDLGWQPYSIKIGDKWYGFNRLDPLASFFGIVGDYFELTQAVGESEEESRSVLESALVMLCAVGKNTTSKTYLQNVTSILSILENPDMSSLGRISSYGAQIAQGFVPRIVTNLARDTGMTDPYMREASGFIDRLKARTPGLGEDVPLQYSWLTGEARAFGSWSLFNFTPVKESVEDQIHAELLSYGAKLGGPSRTQNGQRLTDEQYSRLCELHGTLRIGGKTLMQALEVLARSASYRRLPEGEERMKELNSVIGRYRTKARAQLNREFPELAPKPRWRYTEQTPETDLQKLIRYGQS